MTPIGIVLGVSNLFTAALVVALSVPLIRRRVAMNRWYGVRFAKSFTSDAAWYAINEHGGRRMVFWSWPVAVAGLFAFVLPLERGWAWLLPVAAAPLLYLIACVEIWLWARALDLESLDGHDVD